MESENRGMREMSLFEVVDALPDGHRARVEYAVMQRKLTALGRFHEVVGQVSRATDMDVHPERYGATTPESGYAPGGAAGDFFRPDRAHGRNGDGRAQTNLAPQRAVGGEIRGATPDPNAGRGIGLGGSIGGPVSERARDAEDSGLLKR